MCTVSFAFKRKLPCYDIILLYFIYAVSWKHLRVIRSRISDGCVRYVTSVAALYQYALQLYFFAFMLSLSVRLLVLFSFYRQPF